MRRVANPGDDLLGDLLTPSAGTLWTIAFTRYNIKPVTNSASWLYYISLVLGRERPHCSLKTITLPVVYEQWPFYINLEDF